MKLSCLFIYTLFFISCANGNENTFTGSTPANALIKNFLNIPPADSIDFIRWKIILHAKTYSLQCNYGIGQPNTNGFINGGKKAEFNDILEKENNYYLLHNGNKLLKIAKLNTDLLHFMNIDNNLMVGNGGWSYTLNNVHPLLSDFVNLKAKPTILKDSMVFEGRTPCKVPGIIPAGMECYKLKWLIKLYTDTDNNKPGNFLILGTPWRDIGGKKGIWKIITGKNEQISYQLLDEKGDSFLNLLKLDENILIITDANGKLLTGDADFSYTLNRRF